MYEVIILEDALNDLKKIEFIWQKRIINKLKILGRNPGDLANNIKKLKGKFKESFRLRIGDYRIIFRKKKKQLIILIIRIAHRKEVYL